LSAPEPLLSSSESAAAELHARRSARHSLARRAAAARSRSRRRQGRAGVAVLLGAMTLAAGGAAAQVGGARSDAPAQSASSARSAPATVQVIRRAQARIGVAADGHWGPKSHRALKRWQRRHRLKADGVLGPRTLKALGLARAARAPRKAPANARAGGVSAALARIAACESGGNPKAVSANGLYRGKYQFSRATWRAVGGTGDPARAREAEQDRLAAKLYAAEGAKPWPVCGRG
jgi:hypothetical protein